MSMDTWRETARANGVDDHVIRGAEAVLKEGPTEDAVFITVRVPVEAYHRVEALWYADKCGVELRGSRSAAVDALRTLLPRLPKGVVVTDVHGAYDGRWSHDSIAAAIEKARAGS